jgi:cytochrome c6
MKTHPTPSRPLTNTVNKRLLAALLCLSGALSAQASAEPVDGKAIFTKNCAACHQATGKGIQGAFPPLAGSAFVQGAPADVGTVLLKGRGGMPDFSASLEDEQIAAVLSYVRSSWGNKATPISEADISALRTTLQIPTATGSRLANKH